MGAPGASGSGRTISWRHCLLGLLVGEAVLLLISNGGLAIANAAFGDSGLQHADGGIVGMATFLAVIAGGYVAARTAGRFGIYQGTVVAIGFIVIGLVYQLFQEAGIVSASLSSGSHKIVDLGPMNMGGLITGDLLALFGGSFGGRLGDRPRDEARSQP